MLKNLNGLQKWIDLDCGFEPHLSSSKIATFRNDVPMFICRYGFKMKDSSASMDRGNICEEALVSVLLEEETLDNAIVKAMNKFNAMDHEDLEDHNKQAVAIPDMVKLAYETLKDYGKPEFSKNREQQKIEYELHDELNGWSAPMIGYLDLVYPEQGLIIDLKTTFRMPSVMSWSHQLQRVAYQQGKSNYDVRFLYVTPKKCEFKQDGDMYILHEAKQVVTKMNNFCYLMTPSQARSCIPIGDSFLWNSKYELRDQYNNMQDVF